MTSTQAVMSKLTCTQADKAEGCTHHEQEVLVGDFLNGVHKLPNKWAKLGQLRDRLLGKNARV